MAKKEEQLNEAADKADYKITLLKDCNFSVRAQNCFRAAEIESVEELRNMTSSELLKYRNFGRKTIMEIKEFFKQKYNIEWE